MNCVSPHFFFIYLVWARQCLRYNCIMLFIISHLIHWRARKTRFYHFRCSQTKQKHNHFIHFFPLCLAEKPRISYLRAHVVNKTKWKMTSWIDDANGMMQSNKNCAKRFKWIESNRKWLLFGFFFLVSVCLANRTLNSM